MDEQRDPQMSDENETNAGTDAGTEEAKGSGAGREMLAQLQQMIDTVATQAGPVMRDVAVKAAELAAVAGEKAGPWAYKAAGATEAFGQRVAAKSKDFAADLRRPQDGVQDAATDVADAAGDAAEAGADAAHDVADSAEPPADWSH